MKAAIVAILCVAGTLLVGAGCGADVPGMKTILLDSQDNGRTLSAEMDDSLIVFLPANPSTGYHWQVTAGDASVIALELQRFVPQGAGIGVPGTQALVFEVKKAGTTTLTLGYLSLDGTQTANTFSITVEAVE